MIRLHESKKIMGTRSLGHTEGTDKQHAWDSNDNIISSPDDPKPVHLTIVERS